MCEAVCAGVADGFYIIPNMYTLGMGFAVGVDLKVERSLLALDNPIIAKVPFLFYKTL